MKRRIDFADLEEKARFIDGNARLESNQREVVALAARLCPRLSVPPRVFVLAYLLRVHSWVRDNIRYVRDPGGVEHLADCATILRRGYDDCDGKARLFVALCLAGNRFLPIPCEAAIRPVFPTPEVFSHVQAAVRVPWVTRLEQPDGWIGVELCLEGVPFGSGLEAATWRNGRPVER